MPRIEPEVPLPTEIVTKRAKELSGKWEAETRRAARKPERLSVSPEVAPSAPQQAMSAARATLTVTGPAYAGKSALIGKLVEGKPRAIRPRQANWCGSTMPGRSTATSGMSRHLAASAARSDGVLFVVDQDLRAPEVAAIVRLLATGKPLYVVLNKADQFTSSDRDAIMVSIRGKMPAELCAWLRRGRRRSADAGRA